MYFIKKNRSNLIKEFIFFKYFSYQRSLFSDLMVSKAQLNTAMDQSIIICVENGRK